MLRFLDIFFPRNNIYKRKTYIIYQNQNVARKNFILKFEPETQNCLIIIKNTNSIIKENRKRKMFKSNY